MRKTAIQFTAVVIAALFMASGLFADTIFTSDGRKLEGMIVRETDEFVELEMKYGRVKIPHANIERIERGKTTLQIFEEKYAKLDKKDVKALLELAKWCGEKDLPEERKDLLEKVIELDPGNDEAGEALGYKKKDGAWGRPVKKEPEKKAKKEAKRKKEKPLDAEPEIPVLNREDEEMKALCEMSSEQLWNRLSDRQKNWDPFPVYQCAVVLLVEKGQNTWNVWRKIAWALGEMGDYRESIRASYKAFKLATPEQKVNASKQLPKQLAYAFDRMGEYEKAEENYLEAIELDPEAWWTYYMLASNYKHMERYDEALSHADKALELYDNRIGSLLVKGTCLIVKGQKEEGLRFVMSCERGLEAGAAKDDYMKHGGGQGIYMAEAWCAYGDYDRAIYWLEEHIYKFCKFGKDGNFARREIMRLPLLEPLYDDERFKEIASIPEELDEEEWEYGVVSEGKKVKKGEDVSDLDKKARNENALPPTLAPKDWYVIKTKHYVCISNSLRQRLKELAYRLELMFMEYRKFFKATTDIDETYTVKMFKNRQEFRDYARAHGVEGFAAAYFSFEDKELVLYDSFTVGMGQETFGTVYHEAAHQFICHHLGMDVPIWFHEAVAQYFECAAYTKGRFVVGNKDFEKVQPVQNALMNKKQVNIDEMLKMTRSEFYSGPVSMHYSTAYCFLYFLLDYDKSTMKLLGDFVKTLKETGSSEKAFDESFGKVNIFQLERQFHQYMLKGK